MWISRMYTGLRLTTSSNDAHVTFLDSKWKRARENVYQAIYISTMQANHSYRHERLCLAIDRSTSFLRYWSAKLLSPLFAHKYINFKPSRYMRWFGHLALQVWLSIRRHVPLIIYIVSYYKILTEIRRIINATETQECGLIYPMCISVIVILQTGTA